MPLMNINLKNSNGLPLWGIGLFILGVVLLFSGCGKSASDKANEAIERSVEAATFFNRQNYVKSLATIRQAISLNTELDRDSALGENYLLFAHCQRQLGQYDSAISAFKFSLQYFHLFGDPKLERRARIALAQLYFDLHDYRDASSLASDAAGEAKVFGDNQSMYQAMIIVAQASHKLRNFTNEISLLEELAHDKNLYLQGRFEILELLFHAHIGTGVSGNIRDMFNRWRSEAYEKRDSVETAKAYMAWGHYQESIHQNDSSLKAFSQALSLAGGRLNQALQMEILTSLGNLSYRSQRYEPARLYYNDAVNLARQENNIVLEQLLSLMQIASEWKTVTVKAQASSTKDLEKRCRDIVATCRQTSFFPGEAFAQYIAGTLQSQRGDTARALSAYREALQLIVNHIALDEEDSRKMNNLIGVFMESEHMGWYEPLLRMSAVSQKAGEVFELLEQQNLQDLQNYFSRLTIKTADVNFNGAIEQVTLKRTSLKLLEEDIRNELSTGKHRNLERFETLKELYPARLQELMNSSNAITQENFRWLLFSPSLTLKMVRDTLPRNTALLEYALFENETYGIVVTKDSSYLKKIPVPRQRLLSLVQEYNRLIGDPRLNYNAPMFDEAFAMRRVAELSTVLHSMLVEPLMPLFANAEKLYIVTPKDFGWLPFHTLRSSGSNPLINKFEISYLPSAAALLFASKPAQSVHEVIGFGHVGHTTWDVEYEMKDIRSFYDKARMYFDTTATAGHFLELSCDALHFAAEFFINTQVADSSVMILSDGVTPDGTMGVSLGRLLSVPVPQTIVFSNIATEAGGLSRYATMAFLANGTHTVIAAMWQGERKSKKYFGELFYTNLLGGIPSSAAYQKAITTVAKSEEFSKLYNWGLYYQFGR